MSSAVAPEAFASLVAPVEWRAIDIVSDLHLAESLPRLFDAWSAHLLATSADAVLILGDLFEVWIGDDAAERGFEARCVDVLRTAAERRTVAFMPGNRDFLVGDAVLQKSGVLRLADPTVVEAFGERVVVSHGDALCTGDAAYQRYRGIVRRAPVQRAFTALPLAARRAIAAALRRQSGRMRGNDGAGGRRNDDGHARRADDGRARRSDGERTHFVDVDEAAALAWLRSADASALVHGHTHAPESHAMTADTDRHVLSDWELDGAGAPRAEVLRWSARGFERIAPEGAAAP